MAAITPVYRGHGRSHSGARRIVQTHLGFPDRFVGRPDNPSKPTARQ
jgi:hypothetical protein